jgi:hypothetical protein
MQQPGGSVCPEHFDETPSYRAGELLEGFEHRQVRLSAAELPYTSPLSEGYVFGPQPVRMCPVLDQSGLTQSGFACNEHGLTPRFQSFREPRVELAQFRGPANHARLVNGAQLRFDHGAKKAVTSPVQCLNEAGFVRLVIQCLADIEHSPLQDAFGDVDIRPDSIQ